VVVIEAAMLEAVPIAAANGDHTTVATTCALSNGVFARIHPLVPAPLVFAGIGFALPGTSILPRAFARTAVLVPVLFLITGLAAVFATAGLILAIGRGSRLDRGRRHRLCPDDRAHPAVARGFWNRRKARVAAVLRPRLCSGLRGAFRGARSTRRGFLARDNAQRSSLRSY
jgi:hypothetical protein